MPARDQSFQEVLAAAIDDLLANGFDSMERIERWTRELRAAAERSSDQPSAAHVRFASSGRGLR